MRRIIKIGMDVHSTNYTLCAIESRFEEEDRTLAEARMDPEYGNILKFIERLKKKYHLESEDCDILCGYEAGCLGFSLYDQLTASGIKCVILAPSTMSVQKGVRIKTDKRDAHMIAECLVNNTYHAVHIPSKEDLDVREYIRMRDDHKLALKEKKQQINAFCLHSGFYYDKTKWTDAHINWLRHLDFGRPILREVLDEYLSTYEQLKDKIEAFDARIAEFCNQEQYREKVSKLQCFCGIKTHAALSLLVETGDFQRFPKACNYASFLGLIPGESSSSTDINRLSITKAGNVHLRRLLVEAAQCICRGRVGHKSKDLKSRQAGNPPEVIAYADKASERLRRRYYRGINRGKKRNVIVTAVARELACFIWGMMTDHIYQEGAA